MVDIGVPSRAPETGAGTRDRQEGAAIAVTTADAVVGLVVAEEGTREAEALRGADSPLGAIEDTAADILIAGVLGRRLPRLGLADVVDPGGVGSGARHPPPHSGFRVHIVYLLLANSNTLL